MPEDAKSRINHWWAARLHELLLKRNLSREDARRGWNLLWDEWAKIDTKVLRFRFAPDRLRVALALRKVDPLALMVAPTLLMGLTAKGMSVEELAGLVDSFLDHGWFREYESFNLPDPGTIYSNGFGGDGIKTINVSTAAMIIAASAGVSCYKMGSRTYFGHSGSHNFLDIVGVKPSTAPEHVLQTLRTAGIAYIDGVATADGPTKQIGVGLSIMPAANELMRAMTYPFRFPILVLNPLKPRISIRGVSTPDTEVPAEFLRSYYSYSERFEVVAGMTPEGTVIDEVSSVGPTKITEFANGRLQTYFTSPEDWGVKRAHPRDICCADPWESAMKVVSILLGISKDEHADLVLINASHFLYLAGKVTSRKHGTELARAAVEDGRAIEKLRSWVIHSGGAPAALELAIAAAARNNGAERLRPRPMMGAAVQ